jgi:hypothetical protein
MCGFPALLTMRRCPFCRAAFPRVRRPGARRVPVLDRLAWLAIAWVALLIPLALLAVATAGTPLTLLAVGVGLVPAGFIWLLRGRTLLRIHRLNRRWRAGGGPAERPDGGATGSKHPPSDARSR